MSRPLRRLGSLRSCLHSHTPTSALPFRLLAAPISIASPAVPRRSSVISTPPTCGRGNPNLTAAHRHPSTMTNSASPLPPGTTLEYWQLNLPSDEIPSECPVYLQNISHKDKKVLSTRDADFPVMAWPAIRSTIDANALDRFARLPSDLRRYIEYNHHTKARYLTVGDFILREKLGWPEGFAAAGAWFEDPRDWSVQWNDWPYSVEDNIVHLCVWTKVALPDDREKGDISDETRRFVQEFVDATFGTRVPKENLRWFKNFGFLQSVPNLAHFHVMMYDPDPDFIKEITNGKVPLFKTPGFKEKKVKDLLIWEV